METDMQPKKKSSGKRLGVYLIIILLLVVFAGGYLLGSGNLSDLMGNNPFAPATFVREMRDYVLRAEDVSGSYTLLPGGDSPWSNEEIVQAMGNAEGKKYISETGRVDGWQTSLGKNNNSAFGPETYTSRIQVFESNDGARQALRSAWLWKYTEKEELNDNFSEDTCNIGSDCTTAFFDYYFPESGLVKVRYDVSFRVDNVTIWVSAKGLDADTSLDDALAAAQTLYDQLNDLR